MGGDGFEHATVKIPNRNERIIFFIFIILSNRYFCASRLGVLYGMYG